MSSENSIRELLELLTDRIVYHHLPVSEARAILLRYDYYRRQMRPAAKTLEQIELETIRECLDRHDGDVSKAARELDVSRQTIYRKMNLGP